MSAARKWRHSTDAEWLNVAESYWQKSFLFKKAGNIYGILKDGNDNPICKTEKETDIQNRLLDSGGEGEGGMFGENSIETSILSRVKHHQPRLDAWDKCSGQVHWEDPEGWDGEGGGIGMGNTHKSMADSCQCMAKTTTIL